MLSPSHWSQVVGRLKVGKQALEGELERLTEELEGQRREGVGRGRVDEEVADAIDLLSRALVEGEDCSVCRFVGLSVGRLVGWL